MMKSYLVGMSLVVGLAANVAFGNDVQIKNVDIQKSAEETYRISVTLKHNDEGWDHYANEWQVIAPDGTVLGTRILAHPHVDEQPFTRSLGNVKISTGIEKIEIRAKDSIHGWAEESYIVGVPH